MKKIDKLTPEQEAQLPAYRDKWLKIGLSCDPLDFPAAKEAAVKAYKLAGLAPPNQFYYTSSPLGCALFCAHLSGRAAKKTCPEYITMYGKSTDYTSQAPDGAGAMWDSVYAVVKKQIKDQLGDDLNDTTDRHRLFSLYRDFTGDQVYGSHDAGWLSFYEVFKEVCGVEECSRVDGLIDMAKVCGWWAPYDTCAIFQDRHSEVHRDDQYRLHNDAGPSVRYPDGFQTFHHHGVRLYHQPYLCPEKVTAEIADREPNAEIRRVMIEKMGPAKYMANAKKVHEDVYGKLFKKARKDDSDAMWAEVVNGSPEPDGSFKHYWLRVHPECRPMLPDGSLGNPQPLTCLNAVASTYGMTGNEYAILDERT